jgi:hypothetical protein
VAPALVPPMMKDSSIREALHSSLIQDITREKPDTLVVDELGILEGKFRIDVAVINDQLHGYEIKSAADNLDRLPDQQEHFSKVFDRITLVADESHVAEAIKIVPKNWGLITASLKEGQVVLEEIWPARRNLNVDPLSLCQLLWRQEAIEILTDKGMAYGVKTKRRKFAWEKLATTTDLKEIKEHVRQALKNRTDWRTGRKRRRRRRKRKK